MAVSADHRAVKTDVPRFKLRHDTQLCRQEIGLHDAVFLIEQPDDIKLDLFARLVVLKRAAADQHIQLLALQPVLERPFHLFRGQVRQKVGHCEHRVAVVLANCAGDCLTVLLDDDAVQRQRDRAPLIFFDAAVIVRFEKRDLRLLIQRVRLEVQARRIDVACHDAHTVGQRPCAERRQDQRLAAVVVINTVARTVCGLRIKGRIARLARFFYNPGYRFTFHFTRVKKRLVRFAEILRGLLGRVVGRHPDILSVEQQLFLQKLAR